MYLSASLPLLCLALPGATALSLDKAIRGHHSISQMWESLSSAVSLLGHRLVSSRDPEQSPFQEDEMPMLCNGYAELCDRRFSEVTMVGTHNSVFVQPNSLAANQELDVHQQLDDGVRFLQGQMHWAHNDTAPHFCHTTCDLLDAGPITEWLGQVHKWVASHPNEVVTILLGNGNYSRPEMYAPYIVSTGLVDFAYVPPTASMGL